MRMVLAFRLLYWEIQAFKAWVAFEREKDEEKRAFLEKVLTTANRYASLSASALNATAAK